MSRCRHAGEGQTLTTQSATVETWPRFQLEGHLGEHVQPSPRDPNSLHYPVLHFVSGRGRDDLFALISRLGWFPVLFFTTVWVSDIYKSSQPDLDPSDPAVEADAVRAGARSLFFQSLINIACSIALPFFVSESGIQPQSGAYDAINGSGSRYEQPPSALWKRAQEDITSGGFVRRTLGAAKGLVLRIRDGDGLGDFLPIKGLTLVKVWMISQYTFAAAMVATW